MAQTHKVLISDDHSFFIQGLERHLAKTGKYEIRSAQSLAETLASLHPFAPDLLVIDVAMAEGGGMPMLRQIKACMALRTLVLTVRIDPQDTIEVLRLGIDGIALKDRALEDIERSIDAILAGGGAIDPIVSERALRHSVRCRGAASQQDDRLTLREGEIVELVCQGLRNKEIARRFDLTEGTVKVHLHNVYRKLGVNSRTELIIKHGGMALRAF
jgi:DNA-binding NarL/FixJ family response regulator